MPEKEKPPAMRVDSYCAEKYLKKGLKILVSGRIQTGSYVNQEGNKVYATNVIVEEHYFAEGKKLSGA